MTSHVPASPHRTTGRLVLQAEERFQKSAARAKMPIRFSRWVTFSVMNPTLTWLRRISWAIGITKSAYKVKPPHQSANATNTRKRRTIVPRGLATLTYSLSPGAPGLLLAGALGTIGLPNAVVTRALGHSGGAATTPALAAVAACIFIQGCEPLLFHRFDLRLQLGEPLCHVAAHQGAQEEPSPAFERVPAHLGF